jgi:serine/threonine protein kinase
MINSPPENSDAVAIAGRWCAAKGQDWSLSDRGPLGEGGTAPVFEIVSPAGPRALKIYDAAFSQGAKGEIELKRIDQQLAIGVHDCPYLVQVYDGGRFEDRLFVLMSRAPGSELEKVLRDVPRERIRTIVDQVARAAIFLRSRDLCHRDIKAANIFISEDFSRSTLLDISVIRNVYDPIGSGTDNEGQLPVLATARYSPPEYLFRLLDPGPKLWHALTVYQLGGLLHDLIMREPLFQAEYLTSTTNRYRFAWVVATTIPKIQVDDVDEDLVLTARRSLDKDWERRSVLTLEDFLVELGGPETHSLQLLGLVGDRPLLQPTDNISVRLQRVRDVSTSLEKAILEFLKANAVTATHEVKPGYNDTSKRLVFRWDAPVIERESNVRTIEFQLLVQLMIRSGNFFFEGTASLRSQVGGTERVANMELPEVQDDSGVELTLKRQAASALTKLAVDIARRAAP